MVYSRGFQKDPFSKRAKEIEKLFKDIETGMIGPEEMRKMMEIDSVKRAREQQSVDEDKGWNNLPGQQISRFHANLNKLKHRHDKMDLNSRLPWKGFKI